MNHLEQNEETTQKRTKSARAQKEFFLDETSTHLETYNHNTARDRPSAGYYNVD
jgi:hypothetical protein